jgi:single-stranded-DNA-specific exonuclease
MNAFTIRRRVCAFDAQAWPAGVHPVLARVYAARGMCGDDEMEPRLARLADPAALGGLDHACVLLMDAIEHDRRICVVGDFDADGATGTAVAVRALRLLGARSVGFCVPNRFRHGYGLSPGLVEEMREDAPELIVTVDNGIASHAGVDAARALGMRVIITDHHLPAATLPLADAIVNPNVAGDAFASKALAGVGVVFYLMLALRGRLRDAGAFGADAHPEPDLSVLLDLVALGTVADLVPLDANNRVLVAAGLRRIRAGRASAGVLALCRAAGRDPARVVASDLGFALAPRINAAGRLDDMSLGIECLLADDAALANDLAARLSTINAQRRDMQATMVEQSEATVAAFIAEHGDDAFPQGVVLYQPDWHAGIVGLVASRLKERLHRPVVAFAPVEEGSSDLRGSARSIAGFHLRDALAEVDTRCPGMIPRFGGHAMAAGLSLALAHLEKFAAEFDAVARSRLDADLLERVLWTDGELDARDLCFDVALALRYAGPWGQAFPEPLFDNVFSLESWRLMGETHMQLRVLLDGRVEPLEAVMFNASECMPPPARLRAVYQLDVDEWNGRERLRLLVRHIEAA